ncbi:MAG TPA: hypothetical protein VNE40_04660 [Candidatus Dormibacteraeota bacterium]|nr:hypothetical protein [Candidatus Dormibacteraeota bacterium]
MQEASPKQFKTDLQSQGPKPDTDAHNRLVAASNGNSELLELMLMRGQIVDLQRNQQTSDASWNEVLMKTIEQRIAIIRQTMSEAS